MNVQGIGEHDRVGACPRLWDSLLEVGWLLAAILPPLAVNLWAAQPFEPVKAALLRSVVWAMAAVWIVGGLVQRRSLWREFSAHPLFWPMMAVLGVQTLATLGSVDRGLSVWGSYERAQGLWTLLSYGLLFLLVAARLRTFEQGHRLALALAATAAPLTALGLAQALGWNPLPLITDARSPVYATLGRSNFLGAYLAMLLPLTLAFLLSARSRAQRLAWGGVLAAQAVVLILAQVRGALLAAAVALAIFSLIWFWERLGAYGRWLQGLASGAAGLSLVGVLTWALWAGSSGGSTAARLTIWRAVARLVGERPWLGYGPETLELVFPRVYPPELVYYQGRGVLIDRAHNLVLDGMATTGLIGALAQGALVALFFAVGWRASQRTVDPGRRALLAGGVAGVGGNVVGNLVSFDVTATATATALMMALVVGLARLGGSGATADPVGERSGRPLPKAATAALALLAAAGLGAAVGQANLRPVAADVAALASDRRAAAGDWSGAIGAAERAAALWPAEPVYRRMLSWAWLQWAAQPGVGDVAGLEQAEAALWAARDLRPGEVRTWAALGELYGLWGNRWDATRLPLADQAFGQAVALAPNLATTYTSWGMVHLVGGRWEEAATRFRQAVDLDATDGYAFAHLGEAELGQGRFEEAERAYREAVHWAPDLSAAHAGLAQALWLQGRRAEAQEALGRALALDPNQPAARALEREMGASP